MSSSGGGRFALGLACPLRRGGASLALYYDRRYRASDGQACGCESALDGFPLACAACHGIDMDVTAGEELLVDSLELEEPVTTGGMVDGNS